MWGYVGRMLAGTATPIRDASAMTAWVSEPYVDGADGVGYCADDELAELFHGGHAAGLQVGVHAIGDRAIDQVLSVWERVYHALDSRERRAQQSFQLRDARISRVGRVHPSGSSVLLLPHQ